MSKNQIRTHFYSQLFIANSLATKLAFLARSKKLVFFGAHFGQFEPQKKNVSLEKTEIRKVETVLTQTLRGTYYTRRHYLCVRAGMFARFRAILRLTGAISAIWSVTSIQNFQQLAKSEF